MSVRAWKEEISIPTYGIGHKEKNPMFFEKRVYQGNSGAVYPNPIVEKIFDEKTDALYTALFIENTYLKAMILPELGGKLQMVYDKINHRNMVYYNNVIKPALVGVTGPWTSGGIEFNFPTHHKPSGHDAVDYCIEENTDGSKTIWVSEIERMYRMKGMIGFTLYPDKAYIEISIKLFNRMPFSQSFLWWANPALYANEHFQAIFPPDVTAVYDHGRRDVTKFPIATGTYYKHDYFDGVDISWHKNIPVPTSYMVEESDYDFVAGYDHQAQAGIYHVADHHVAPGKKFWTWGSSEFSEAWDRQLTDDDGPYVELMTGVASNNQPDLSWIAPYEEKSFVQYFMPYKGVANIKNANTEACVGLDVDNGKATVKLYVTAPFSGLRIILSTADKQYLSDTIDTSPEHVYIKSVVLDGNETEQNLILTVERSDGSALISYCPGANIMKPMLEAAKEPLPPTEIHSTEQLYLTAVHLEQYRHATCEPDQYYLEALKRDPSDVRCNNGYGLLLFKRGMFADSEKYFYSAIKTLTERNPNPNFTEPFFNLGIALKYQNKLDEAYRMIYKSMWTTSNQDSGYFSLAQIDCILKLYDKALAHVERSLIRNYHNHKARHLKAVLLRKLGKTDDMLALIEESLKIDCFNMGLYFEQYFYLRDQQRQKQAKAKWDEAKWDEIVHLLRNDKQNYIEYAFDYMQAGMYMEAIDILKGYLAKNQGSDNIYPLILYMIGYAEHKLGDDVNAKESFLQAAKQKPDYCFPNQLEVIDILKVAMQMNPKDAKAPYYLGNLYYARRQHAVAIGLWEKSLETDNQFSTVHRNLALAYYNVLENADLAHKHMETAFNLDTSDHRVFMELDQLRKIRGVCAKDRIERLENNKSALNYRDDLSLELITLYNEVGEYEKAYQLITSRSFHPWEANEGKVGAQWTLSLREMARKKIHNKQFQEAIELLDIACKPYPDNLGEGKLPGMYENDVHYYHGIAYEGLGDTKAANHHYSLASFGKGELSMSMFYNDQPAYRLFYEGLAKQKLGNTTAARGCFYRLIDYGESNLQKQSKIDFFAIQLADTSVFNKDLNKDNTVHSYFLMGLGYLGLGEHQKASVFLKKALELDQNHQEAIIHLAHLTDCEFCIPAK